MAYLPKNGGHEEESSEMREEAEVKLTYWQKKKNCIISKKENVHCQVFLLTIKVVRLFLLIDNF